MAGLRALGFAPALPRSRPCGVLARWWASGASRFRDDGTPTGRWRAPRRGLGPQSLRCGILWGGDETAGPWLRRGGSRAACGGSRAGAWRGCGRWGSPPLFPVPGPAACLRAGGRLAPRGSVMTEPPRAAGGRLAEGWAHEY